MRRFSALGYPQGGWSTVLDSLTGAVERPGNCDYVLGARLERVFAYAGRVERVLVNGREVDAGAVVCAFPPQRLAEKGFVEPGLPLGYAARLAALEEGGGVFVDIGLERPVTDDPRLIISPDPPALVWAVSNIAPEVAPRGRQLLQLFSPIPGSELDDGALVAARVAALTGLAQELFGGDLPEAWRRVKSSLIVSVVPYTDQSRRSRPSVEVPGVEGLYLIGDGVSVPGLGGELAARSALIAARMLRRRAGDRARPARQRLMPEWGYS